MYIQPIIEGQFYHIYNRGVNGENLFKEKKELLLLLDQYKFYCADILETLAYCLLKNHFHMLVRVRENVEVPKRTGPGMFKLNASKQLSHFFNSYAQSINKACKRTGPLFESPFERKLIDDESYLINMIYYCHKNPVHHGFVTDLTEWEFSSYHSILANDNNLVATVEILKRFGNINNFKESHRLNTTQTDLEKYIIEV